MKCSCSCLGAKSGRKTRYYGRDLKLYHLANQFEAGLFTGILVRHVLFYPLFAWHALG